MSHNKTVIGQRKKPISDALKKLRLKIFNKWRFIRWDLKESLKWHFKCLSIFWKLPNALRHALNAGASADSFLYEKEKALERANTKVENLMDIIADNIWAKCLDELGVKHYKDAHEDFKYEIRKEIRDFYIDQGLKQILPKEYQQEEDDDWEQAYEESVLSMPGGPNYDYRPDVYYTSKHYLKKNNLKSEHKLEFGGYND